MGQPLPSPHDGRGHRARRRPRHDGGQRDPGGRPQHLPPAARDGRGGRRRDRGAPCPAAAIGAVDSAPVVLPRIRAGGPAATAAAKAAADAVGAGRRGAAARCRQEVEPGRRGLRGDAACRTACLAARLFRRRGDRVLHHAVFGDGTGAGIRSAALSRRTPRQCGAVPGTGSGAAGNSRHRARTGDDAANGRSAAGPGDFHHRSDAGAGFCGSKGRAGRHGGDQYRHRHAGGAGAGAKPAASQRGGNPAAALPDLRCGCARRPCCAA